MKIGFTCSAFDLFHAGHICMLEEAKQHCDFLIVGLQTDPTIDRPAKNRPVQSVYERWVQLAACQYIDRIIPYATEKELLDILQSQNIDVRFVGEEYMDIDFTGKDLGISIHYNKRRHSFSTTELRQRVFNAQIQKREIAPIPGIVAQVPVGHYGPGIALARKESYNVPEVNPNASTK